ncbi:MAG: HNH endonuclease [Solirubrobacteraceae bacterium]
MPILDQLREVTTEQLRAALIARIPAGEILQDARAVPEQANRSQHRHGLLGLSEQSLIWVWESLDYTRRGLGTQLEWVVSDEAIGDRRDPAALLPGRHPSYARQALREELARMYYDLEEWSLVLELTARQSFFGAATLRGDALLHSDMCEAALVAYDEALRDRRLRGTKLASISRHNKAVALVELGAIPRARHELTRLIAEDPTYEPARELLGRIGSRMAPAKSRAPIPESVRHSVWRRDRGRCVECGSQENLEFDHVIPVAKGGANTERNLQLLCQECNRRKGATI